MTASLHRLLNGLDIRDLTKLPRRRERERERQTSNSFNEQNNSARASRFFSGKFLRRLCTTRTWNGQFFKFTWERERQGDKFYRARSPLFSTNVNSYLLSNMATWDNGEIVCKDKKCIFQRRRRCWIVRSL